MENTAILILLPLLLPLAGIPLTIVWRKSLLAQKIIAIGTLVLTLAATIALFWHVFFVATSPTTLFLKLGGHELENGFAIGITFRADPLGVFMLLMGHIVMLMGALYAAGCIEKAATYPPFYPLFLALTTGLSGAFLTGDLFNLFVFTEIIVVAGAALTALSDDKNGAEASYKYFYISTVAAVSFLLAVGAFYVSFGTLNMQEIAKGISDNAGNHLLVGAGLTFLTVTFLIKSAAVPFHFWQPDFHTAAPTPVHAVLSSVVVKVGFYGLIRLTYEFFPNHFTLQTVLVVLGVAGVIFGGLGAAGTYSVKRMLAYSTMSQLGFMLVALGWATPLALTAALVFAFNHALVKAGMLMMAGAMASRTPNKDASFESVLGVGKLYPFAGILFLLGGMALAGIPPLNGFISKLMVFQSGVESENYLALALIGIASIVTLTYVIRSFVKIWFEQKKEKVKYKKGDALWAPLLLIGLSLILGIYAEPLVASASTVVTELLSISPVALLGQ
jgi:multicomponent Na+:H+ antiporter subunit D